MLRLLQNSTGYEADTGLPIPGNFAALALAVLLAGLAAALIVTARLLPAEEDPGPILPRDFSTENTALLTLPMCGVFLLGLSGLSDLACGSCRRASPPPATPSTASSGPGGWAIRPRARS